MADARCTKYQLRRIWSVRSYVEVSCLANNTKHCVCRCLQSRRRTNWLVLACVRTLRESTGSSCRCTVIWSTRGRSVCGCCSTCTPRCSGRRTPAATRSTAPGDASSLPARLAAVRGLRHRRWRSTVVFCHPSRRSHCHGSLRASISLPSDTCFTSFSANSGGYNS